MLNLENILSNPTAAFPVDGQHGSLKQKLPQGQGTEVFGADDSKYHYGIVEIINFGGGGLSGLPLSTLSDRTEN